MGKELTEIRSLHRKHPLNMQVQTLDANLKQRTVIGLRKASISEEPGAVVPHAGICAGRGRVTALSTATAALYILLH